MGVIPKKKCEDDAGNFLYGTFVGSDETDVAVLEDISGRITVKTCPIFNINHFVSGTILALNGRAITGGYFEVEDYCFAGIPF